MISFPSGDQTATNRRCFALNGNWVIFAFGCTLILCSCSRNHQLKGEIFIVTQAHESVKLGLVEVRAFRPSQVSPIIESERKRIDEEEITFAPIAERVDALKARAEVAKRAIDKATFHHVEQFFSRADDVLKDCTRLSRLSQRIQPKRTAHHSELVHFFEALPDPIASTKTDSDGKFTITLPDSGETIICATADRNLLESTEHYYWMIKAKPSSNTTITLSNDNLATSGSPQSLIFATGSDPEPKSSVEDLKKELSWVESEIKALESDFAAAKPH